LHAENYVPAGRLTYEGRASSDGNSITGAVTQGTNPLTLNLIRATPATAWTIPEPSPSPTRMAGNARLVFEVATIKPSAPDAQGAAFTVRPGLIEIRNRPLANLMREAYNLHPSQVIGARGWIETERYTITGKPEAAGQPNIDQLRQMLRNLLAERFNLKFHMEERELSVYAIAMGKTGQHKLTATSSQGTLPGGDFRGAGAFIGRNSTIADLAS
ncbi:MAG: TIGR03435 family protein, partial [Terriglobia bacterium]